MSEFRSELDLACRVFSFFAISSPDVKELNSSQPEAIMKKDQVRNRIEEVKSRARDVPGKISADMNLARKGTIQKVGGRFRFGLGGLAKYLVKTM